MTRAKPSAGLVTLCGVFAAAALVVAIYFGGTARLPLAMASMVAFVALGGVTFELARRRSV